MLTPGTQDSPIADSKDFRLNLVDLEKHLSDTEEFRNESGTVSCRPRAGVVPGESVPHDGPRGDDSFTQVPVKSTSMT